MVEYELWLRRYDAGYNYNGHRGRHPVTGLSSDICPEGT